MRLAIGKWKPKRICDVLVVLAILANILYIIYYRSSVFEDELAEDDEMADSVDKNGLFSVFREFHERDLPKDVINESANSQKDGFIRRSVDNVTQPCSIEPPFLVGDLACDCGTVKLESLVSNYSNIEPGGRIRPRECRPGQRTAVIIPFRDRHEHLHTLLNMLLPVLQRQQADATFFVLEQTKESAFNRAALQNIGFLEALKTDIFDCFIFHDVDLVPLNDHNLYRCGPNPIHFIAQVDMTQVKAKLMYTNYTGGVIAFSRAQYQVINGNSNLYFGWGGEDDDLYQRIDNKHLSRDRPHPDIARYKMLHHKRQETKLDNQERFPILKTARKRQDVEGLNSCKYKVNFITRDHLYTWVNVSLNVTEMLMTAPDYVLQDIATFLKSGSKT